MERGCTRVVVGGTIGVVVVVAPVARTISVIHFDEKEQSLGNVRVRVVIPITRGVRSVVVVVAWQNVIKNLISNMARPCHN